MGFRSWRSIFVVSYIGRLAPSPTGYLHLGHARTFGRAFERARAAGGLLKMRIEDLDPERSRAEYVQAAMDDLRWLGIAWSDEVMFQSARKDAYRAAWRRLLDGGWIYPCRCSRRDLAAVARAPHELPDEEPVYPGICRGGEATLEQRLAPVGVNWRFHVPDGEAIAFVDGNLGPQRFVAGRDFGDFLVWRRDDVPAYQIACVVDDEAQGVTEVVRGADLLVSTARQILLARALGFRSPDWFHCELMTDEHGMRLAKRHDALSLRGMRERGVTAEEVLARLG